MSMSEALLTFLFIVLFAISLICFAFGFDHSYRSGCKYKSIATRFNPAYRLGCELSKPRY